MGRRRLIPKVCAQLLLGVFALALFSLDARAESKLSSLHAFVPTDLQNPAPGRSDALRLELSAVDLDELGALLIRLKTKLPKIDKRHPPTIPIYLTPDRTPKERRALEEKVREQFAIAFPGVSPRVEIHDLQDSERELKKTAKQTGERIDELAKTLPDDDESRAFVAQLREANDIALAEALKKAKEQEAAIESRRQGMTRPRAALDRLKQPIGMRRFVIQLARAKALVVGVARVLQVGASGLQNGWTGVAAGLGIIVEDTVLKYYWTRFELALDRRIANHGLPLSKAWQERHPLAKKINELYTHSEISKIVKETLVSAGMDTGVAPLRFELSHLNNPNVYEPVSRSRVGGVFRMSLTGNLVGALGYRGYEKLLQKGWVGQPFVDFGVRAAGVLGALTFLSMTSHPMLFPLAKYFFTAAAVSNALAFVTGYLLPARNRRFVLVDPKINNREDLDALEALDATHPLKLDESLEEEVAKIKTKPVNACWRRLGQLVKHGFSHRFAVR